MEKFIIKNKDGSVIDLTSRELEIISLLKIGKRTKWIANELILSPRTVDNHILRIREKAGAISREELCDLVIKKKVLLREVEEIPTKDYGIIKKIKKDVLIKGILFFILSVFAMLFFIFNSNKENVKNVFEWNIPLEGSVYVPREGPFKAVSEYLKDGSNNHIITLYGLAGVGKTTFVKNFILAKHTSYKYKIWFNSETPSVLKKELLEFGEYKSLYDKSDRTEIKIIKVIKWLEEIGEVILVFDNVERYENIKGYIPRNCDVLITSRNNKMPSPVYMDVMSPKQAENLFIKTYVENKVISSEKKVEIRKILEQLGYLPLAIVQAAAYIRENSLDLKSYQRLYEENVDFCLKKRPIQIQDHLPVYVTWEISLDKVSSQEAINLLNYMSILLPEKVNKDLLTYILYGSVSINNKAKLDDIISLLKSFSLVSVDGDNVFMHRLLHSWILRKMEPKTRKENLKYTLERLSKLYHSPLVHIKNIGFIRDLIPHTVKVLKLAKIDFIEPKSELYKIYLGLSKSYDLMGEYEDRKKFMDLAYAESVSIFGEESPETALVYYALGRFEIRTENFIKAEKMISMALSSFEKESEKYSGEILLSLNQLGRVYGRLSKYKEAINVLEKALVRGISSYGKDHIEVGDILNELGWVLFNYGEYEKAKECLLQSVEIHERNLGKKHVETARVLKSLGCVLIALRDLDSAEEVLRRSHKIRSDHYGINHIKVLNVKVCMAILTSLRGNNDKAIEELEECKNLLEKLYGDNLIFRAALEINLANLYFLNGDREKALVSFNKGTKMFLENPSTNAVNMKIAQVSFMLFSGDKEKLGEIEKYLREKISIKNNYLRFLEGKGGDLFLLNT